MAMEVMIGSLAAPELQYRVLRAFKKAGLRGPGSR
jgi:hypothetical protein